MEMPIQSNTCVIRNTAAAKGRSRSVAPGATAARHLHYGRIILDAGMPAERVDPGDHETGLVSLRGSATVRLGSESFALTPYDALYIPHHTAFVVEAGPAGCDLAEL